MTLPSRILRGLAGALVLGLSALFSLGTALAAPVGVLVARRVLGSRGRALTRTGSWVAAITASTIAVAGGFAVKATTAPPGAFRRFQQAAEARESKRPAPPDWLTRLAPQAGQPPDPVTERIIRSRAFTVYFGLIGIAVAVAILGTVIGSAGWLGTILLQRALVPRERSLP